MNTVIDQQSESWRPVPSHPRYEVSNYGNVRSWLPQHGKPLSSPKMLRASPKSTGYRSFTAYDNGRRTEMFVHRAVAAAFIGPAPSERHEINHKDGNPVNNMVENLEWVTPSENARHSHRVLGKCNGENHGLAKLTVDAVVYIRQMHKHRVSSIKLAKRFGVTSVCVQNVINNKTWTSVR